jgi:hypothetical protein
MMRIAIRKISQKDFYLTNIKTNVKKCSDKLSFFMKKSDLPHRF